jgi:hypothetical protein
MSILLSIGSALKPLVDWVYRLQKKVLLSGAGGVYGSVKNAKKGCPAFLIVFLYL